MKDLAAAPWIFRALKRPGACWADRYDPDRARMFACGRDEASDLGLCADDLRGIFGIEAAA